MNPTFHKIAWPVVIMLFMISTVFPIVVWFAIGWLTGTCLVTVVELWMMTKK
jgi:hypothetical protein